MIEIRDVFGLVRPLNVSDNCYFKKHTQSAAVETAVNLRFKIQRFAFKPTDTLTVHDL